MSQISNGRQSKPSPRQVTYPEARVGVQPTQDGMLLIFQTPLETIVFPLARDAAKQLAGQLSGGIHVASELPT